MPEPKIDWDKVAIVTAAIPDWADTLFPDARRFLAWLAVRALSEESR